MKRNSLFALVFVFWGMLALARDPDLQSGDLIFQTSTSNQAQAILFATDSPYSHVGVIDIDSTGRKFVVEAISTVSRTPLDQWIRRGENSRYTVFRSSSLDANKRKDILAHAKAYLGRPYDIFFSFKNNEIYCSELVYLAYKDSGVSLGRVQKMKELNVDNELAKGLARQRWNRHPLCKTNVRTFDECWPRILNDEVITPASLANDPRLTLIFTNY